MKVSVIATSLLIASASALAVEKRQEEDDGGRTINVGDAINSITSKVGSITSEIGSIPTNIAGDIETKLDEIKDDIEGAFRTLTDLDIVIPAFPTISVDAGAVSSFVDSIKTKIEPDWVSSFKNGETPAELKSIIDAVPTNYEDQLKAEISNQLVDAANNVNKDDDTSKAPVIGSGVAFTMAAAAIGTIALAIGL